MIATDSTISALWSRMKDYVRAYVSEYDRMDVATTEVTGQVKPDGTSITIEADGTIHGGAATVPVATTSTAGKVRPDGTTIDVDASGTISVIGASGPHWEVRTDADGNRRLAIVIPEEA